MKFKHLINLLTDVKCMCAIHVQLRSEESPKLGIQVFIATYLQQEKKQVAMSHERPIRVRKSYSMDRFFVIQHFPCYCTIV